LAALMTTAIPDGPALAKPSERPVKLLLIADSSGGATAPEVENGAKAAVKALNRKDGINGSPVALTVCDTKNDAATATDCGQAAVDGKYLAAIGSDSMQADKYFPLLQAAQIPMVGNNVADPADFVSPASFPLSGGIVSTIGGLASALADAGAEKISVAYMDLAQGAIVPTLANMALKRYNLAVLNKVAVPDRAPAMASYVEAATANGSDGIVLAISGHDAINFIQSYLSLGNTGVKFALVTTDAAAVLDVSKGEKNLDVFGSASFDRRNKQFLKDMLAAGYKKVPVGEEITSYAAVMAVAQAAQGLTTLDAPSLYAKLPTVNALDLGSIMPVVDFTKAGQIIPVAPRVSNACVKTTKLGKREFVIQSKSWADAYTGVTCQAG
jgi:branched-chain amino acid transport system substrate-binding protein